MSENKLTTDTLTFAEIQAMARYLQGSKCLPRHLQNREVDIAMIIATGQELGLQPMASLRAVRILDGQPVLSADAMVAVVLKSGAAVNFRLVESTTERAVAETMRRGDPVPRRAEFTIADAERAGLLGEGDNPDESWRKHPAEMLAARVKTRLARNSYPDSLMGVYSPDEAREFAPAADEFRPAPPPVPEQTTGAVLTAGGSVEALHAEILQCTTTAQLEALLPQMLALPGEDRVALSEPYAAHKRELERR
jgi:hypothetical protein